MTSPPYYGLRRYRDLPAEQLGLEKTPDEYVEKMVAIFREVRRVLRDDGTLWLNIGDTRSTGGGKVGNCPGGGRQGEDFRRHFGKNSRSPRAEGITQPNRMPLPGLKRKDLIGVPWLLAFALRADGWYLRDDIIWAKSTSCETRAGRTMPESVTDRPVSAFEHVFLFSKAEHYYYDHKAVEEPAAARNWHDASFPPNTRTPAGQTPRSGNRNRGPDRNRGEGFTRNLRNVWRIDPQPSPYKHYATMPEKLAEPCILAGSPPGEIVLDPFAGSGTTGAVAIRYGRRFIGLDLSLSYLREMAAPRLARLEARDERLSEGGETQKGLFP